MISRRTSLVSGLYRTLPALKAETTRIFGRIPRGTCVFLIDPSASRDEDEVTVVGTALMGDVVEQAVPWEGLRHIELGRGSPAMTTRCWRASRSEMQHLANELCAGKEPAVVDFGVKIDQ